MHQYNFPGYSTGGPKPPSNPRQKRSVTELFAESASSVIQAENSHMQSEWYPEVLLSSNGCIFVASTCKLIQSEACIRNSDGSIERVERMEPVDIQFHLISRAWKEELPQGVLETQSN